MIGCEQSFEPILYFTNAEHTIAVVFNPSCSAWRQFEQVRSAETTAKEFIHSPCKRTGVR